MNFDMNFFKLKQTLKLIHGIKKYIKSLLPQLIQMC